MTAHGEFSSIKPGVLLERTAHRAQGPGDAKQRSGKLLLTEDLAALVIPLLTIYFHLPGPSMTEEKIAAVCSYASLTHSLFLLSPVSFYALCLISAS